MHGATWDLVVVVMLVVGNTIPRVSAMCEAAVSEKCAGLQRRQVGRRLQVGNREGEIAYWAMHEYEHKMEWHTIRQRFQSRYM